jgi:hypothetical protein
MSIGRSITKKSSRYGFGSLSSLEDSKRHSISKNKISAPVALLSTTNMISYTAPSLRNSLSHGSISSNSSGSGSPTSMKSPLSPLSFGYDSDHSDSPLPTNHLSTYFSSAETPQPVRSQSTRHVKKSTSSLSRPRHPSMPPPPKSSSRKTGWPPTAQPPKELHSARGFSGQHPFGAELAQVAEMTEEIAGMNLGDAEEQFMVSRGLQRFRASEYEQEIWQGMGGVFEDELPSFGTGWI